MIKIAHIYYDLLNLYGEQGNVMALINAFNDQNVKVKVDKLTINDKFDLDKYDIIYIGTGSKENLLLAIDDIKKHYNEFKDYIENEKYLISTGSSYLLFGKSIEIDDVCYKCANIFDYYAAESNHKITMHSFFKYSDDFSPIIGFQNRRFIVNINDNHLFSVITGTGDNFKTNFEGYHYKNFIGTHLIGPLLIRNPQFLGNIVKDILEKKGYKYHEDTNTPFYKAYNEYLKNFYENT